MNCELPATCIHVIRAPTEGQNQRPMNGEPAIRGCIPQLDQASTLFGSAVRQLVNEFVLSLSAVATNPLAIHHMSLQLGGELLPEVDVFDSSRPVSGRAPTTDHPRRQQFCDPAKDVLAVNHEMDVPRFGQEFQPPNHSRQFHAVVRRFIDGTDIIMLAMQLAVD